MDVVYIAEIQDRMVLSATLLLFIVIVYQHLY